MSAQVFGSFMVWSCHLLASAREQGWGDHNGPDWDREDALNFLRHKRGMEGRVLIRPRGDLYLHHSRTPGKARFIARMRPVAVAMSKAVYDVTYDNLPVNERENHLLASTVARKRGGKQQMVPVREAYPYLIVRCEPWDADENMREMLRGIHATLGKHGAAGTAFHVYVDTFDQQDDSTYFICARSDCARFSQSQQMVSDSFLNHNTNARGVPAATSSSIPHSLAPRRMRNRPLSPQCLPQLLTTIQNGTPPSDPHPMIWSGEEIVSQHHHHGYVKAQPPPTATVS